jgi:hypothetical protein
VPIFDRFQVQRTVDLVVRKTDPITRGQVKVMVVAFNVGGVGGIADGWRRNGLSS